jgi:hypothetical protein
MFDLPRKFREYFCMNCGERFWFDTTTLTVELRPLTTSFPKIAYKN